MHKEQSDGPTNIAIAVHPAKLLKIPWEISESSNRK